MSYEPATGLNELHVFCCLKVACQKSTLKADSVIAVRYAQVSLPTTSLCLKSSTSLQLAYVFVPKNVLLTFHSCPYESTILEISYQIAATVNCNCNAILLVGTKVLNHGCFIAVLSYFSTHILRHSSHEILNKRLHSWVPIITVLFVIFMQKFKEAEAEVKCQLTDILTRNLAVTKRPRNAPCCWKFAITQSHSRSLEFTVE